MVFNVLDAAVSNSNDSTLLYELNVFAFKESIGGSSFISHNCLGDGKFSLLNSRKFDGSDLDIDVVSTKTSFESLYLSEFWLSELYLALLIHFFKIKLYQSSITRQSFKNQRLLYETVLMV